MPGHGRIAVLAGIREQAETQFLADHRLGAAVGMLGFPSYGLLSPKERNAEDFVFERNGVAVVGSDDVYASVC